MLKLKKQKMKGNKKMSKQVYTLSKNEIIEVLKNEIELQEKLQHAKEIKKCSIVLNMLDIADFKELKVEGVRNNDEKRKMVNLGSVVECLVKHHLKKYAILFKSFNEDTPDYQQGFLNIEIKTSLPNARNTALKEPSSVILVNTQGVFRINKKVCFEVARDSQGRYYENLDYSSFEGVRKIKTLSAKLGLI